MSSVHPARSSRSLRSRSTAAPDAADVGKRPQTKTPKSKKPRKMPGLELPEILESKSVFRDDWRSRVKQVVEAHLEDMLVGAHVLSLGKGQTKIGVRAGCCEDNVFGTETQVVVFKLCSPVIGEGIFQTKTDQRPSSVAAPRVLEQKLPQ